MSAAEELIEFCAARDIQLRPGAGGRLVINTPLQALTPELKERLRAHKNEVLTAIKGSAQRANDSDPYGVPAAPSTRVCAREVKTIRLCGNNYPAIPPTVPPKEIWADPIPLCVCGRGRVLSELRQLTGGRCYGCWTKSLESQRR